MTAKTESRFQAEIRKIADGLSSLITGTEETQTGTGETTVSSDTTSLAQQFKQWASDVASAEREPLFRQLPAATKEFTTWLASLSDEELKHFIQRLGAFCKDSHFQLSWLFDSDVQPDAQTKQALEEAVLLFALSRWQAARVNPSITAFNRFLAWQKNPLSKEHKAMTQKLFAKLVEKGLITEPPASLLLLSEEERRNYVMQAIQNIAENDKQALLAIFKEVL